MCERACKYPVLGKEFTRRRQPIMRCKPLEN